MKHKTGFARGSKKKDGRSAWNETVRELSKQGPRRQTKEKRETRRRRAAATRNRYVVAATTDEELTKLRYAARIDAMVGYREGKRVTTEDDEDDEYLDEVIKQEEEKTNKVFQKKQPKKRKTTQSDSAAARERRHRPRLLSQLLLDHFGDGESNGPDWFTSIIPKSQKPYHKICYVTGRPAKYTDQVTGLYCADRHALAHLREHPPSWVRASAPASSFTETLNAIRQARFRKHKDLFEAKARAEAEAAAAAQPPPAQRRRASSKPIAKIKIKKKRKVKPTDDADQALDDTLQPAPSITDGADNANPTFNHNSPPPLEKTMDDTDDAIMTAAPALDDDITKPPGLSLTSAAPSNRPDAPSTNNIEDETSAAVDDDDDQEDGQMKTSSFSQ